MNEVINKLNCDLSQNDKIVVATSGGPDSMALLNILADLKNEKNLTIICAHVNHQHRLESNDEEKMVENFCNVKDIIFELYTIKEYKNNKFTENEARKIRYRFFEETVKKYDAKYLMTAHHGDDLIETILMRLTRGSNLKGYSGFKEKTNCNGYILMRPLLSVTKYDILEYCEQKKIIYAIDQSNESMVHTRNRFRKNILPLLKKEDKNVHKKFIKFSNELIKYDTFVNNYIEKCYKNVCHDNQVDITELNKEDDFIIIKIFEKMISNIQKNAEFDISDKHIKAILKIKDSDKPNVIVNLPNGFIAKKNYNYLSIEKYQSKEKYEYNFNGLVKLPNNWLIKEIADTNEISNFVTRLDSKEVGIPLKVRCKKEGDIIHIKNLNGSKKVKDIFIDEKINKEVRETIPILVNNSDEIIWIPGIKKSKFDKKIDEKYDIILKYEEEKIHE